MGSVRHLLALPTQPHFRPQINWRSLKRLKVEVCPFHPPNPPSPTLFACSGFALRKQEGFQTIEPSDSPSTSDGRIPYELCNQNGKKFWLNLKFLLSGQKKESRLLGLRFLYFQSIFFYSFVVLRLNLTLYSLGWWLMAACWSMFQSITVPNNQKKTAINYYREDGCGNDVGVGRE